MNVSPLAMPPRKPDHTATVARPVYTTTTGQTPRGEYVEDGTVQPAGALPDPFEQPFCFVCSRCTDHFAEHDDLVEAGLARYTGDGSVHKTDRWDDDLAASIATAADRAYLSRLGL